MSRTVRVVVADSHLTTRLGLEVTLSKCTNGSTKVVGQTSDWKEMLGLVKRFRPDLLIFDLNLTNCPGLAMFGDIARANPRTATILHTELSEHEFGVPAL